MAKPLSQLIDKLDPAVVAAARQKADKEIFELRLAMLREELAVSQVELAKRLGISQPSVANLEKR
ncbi:helix-turn-helix domain-containing protein, partial [Klebsiella pneumoniae]|uniref:helix-turn-helix domain-containing protein n=2 Tax=Enterobacterales TaxID=91347 RepID=UPI00226DED41